MEEGGVFMRAQSNLRMETSEDLEAPNTNSDSKSPLKGWLLDVVIVTLVFKLT